MLPEKNRKEWEALVTGAQTYPIQNFVLQMKVSQTAKDIKLGKLPIKVAIDEIYDLCKKYEKAISKDLDLIFVDKND